MKQVNKNMNHIILHTHKVWQEDAIPYLICTMDYPQFEDGKKRFTRRLNRYYAHAAKGFISFCERELRGDSYRSFLESRRQNIPFSYIRATVNCTVTLRTSALLSLYLDYTEYSGTRRAITIRRADTWNLKTGQPLSLQDLFPTGIHLKRGCLSLLKSQLCERNETRHFCNSKTFRRIKKYFNSRNFYLTENALQLFYQPYTLWDSSAVTAFPLPYNNSFGPFLPQL